MSQSGGRRLWLALVGENVAEDGELTVEADSVQVLPGGALGFVKEVDSQMITTLIIPAGSWWACAMVDVGGFPIAVPVWPGVSNERPY